MTDDSGSKTAGSRRRRRRRGPKRTTGAPPSRGGSADAAGGGGADAGGPGGARGGRRRRRRPPQPAEVGPEAGTPRAKRGGKRRGGKGRRGGRRPAHAEAHGPADSDAPREERSRAQEAREPRRPQEAPASAPAPVRAPSREPRWGDDTDAPAPEIHLSPDLPPDPDPGDPDPVTAPIEDGPDEGASLDATIHNAVGVKFAPAGKIYVYDAGEAHYTRGDTVVVEGDRGSRIGTVAVPARRRPAEASMKRVLRRPNRGDRRAIERGEQRADEALELARERARALGLPIKVFRVEPSGTGKLLVYFSSEEKVDFRELVRDLGQDLKARVEMRQTGVRDEAKMVGGIGSCGQELCCTTWLPSFVPVSIKMAKDQGMVLNPTKVAGQCGRLKCCLVYEQATYAELRKGLPKLGKRVVTERGEGRVVEVDVLRQRVRVSHQRGEFDTYDAAEVTPKFPSQTPRPSGAGRKKR